MKKRPKYQFYQCWPSGSIKFLGIHLWLCNSAWQSIYFQFLNAGFSLVATFWSFCSNQCIFLPLDFIPLFPFHISICEYHKEPVNILKSRMCNQVSYNTIIHFFLLLPATDFKYRSKPFLNLRKLNPDLKGVVRNPTHADILKLTEITVGDLHNSLLKNHFWIRTRTFQ